MDSLHSLQFFLRRLKTSDFDLMRLLESDPLVMQYTGAKVIQSPEQTKKRIAHQIEKQKKMNPFGIWLAETKIDKKFIGWFMLVPDTQNQLELGYMITQENWGKGFTTEICKTLIHFAENQEKKFKIIAKTSVEHYASIRVLIKLGFTFENYVQTEDGTELKLFKYCAISIKQIRFKKT